MPVKVFSRDGKSDWETSLKLSESEVSIYFCYWIIELLNVYYCFCLFDGNFFGILMTIGGDIIYVVDVLVLSVWASKASGPIMNFS